KTGATSAKLAKAAQPDRTPAPHQGLETNPALASQIAIVGELDDLLCVLKPAGLPTHPGSGHADSLVTRLAQLYPGAVFPPTPVHRLDRDTSGLLLVATTFASLRQAQELLKTRSGIAKEYLAWAEGDWPWQEDRLLRHFLAVRRAKGMEKMAAVGAGEGREASLIARPLARRAGATLLQIRLLTGRKHQIRVQLAAEGHPIVGDAKYGAFRGASSALHLRLHAFRIVLPGRAEFTRLPSWEAPWEVCELPAPIEADGEARQPAAAAGS
ncbi:MAG: RNA pseudouridine synthase, partial [Desulfovibrio sp.]|nr:RNA pseudouridine synthase [Desulfovibrio sp.]